MLVEKEDQTKTISFEPEWLRKEVGVNPNDAFLVLVDGDSTDLELIGRVFWPGQRV